MQNSVIFSAVTLAVILADASPSVAAGAMAVGLPSDVVKSMGFEVNIDTMDNANPRVMGWS